MKKYKILSLFLSIALVFAVFTSCEVTQFDIANGGEEVGVNMFPPSIMVYKRGETTAVAIPYDGIATKGTTIESFNVFKQLIVIAGSSDVVSYMNQTGDTFDQTSAQLYADVPVNGTTYNDNLMNPGDKWVFSFEMNLSDGRVLIGSTSTAETDVEFTCPSTLGGDWATLGTWVDYYGVPGQNNFTETFTPAATEGQYVITDLSGGMEPIIWGNPEVEATIKEVCGVITLVSADYLYGYSIDDAMVNADGTITIKWRNEYDEYGENTYTPQ